MADLELSSVNKTYANEVRAVRDLDLRIEEGELFVLVGPSGCGKTTTLRLIAGLEQPDRGQIRFGNRDVTSLPPAERDVAMVVQNAALYPHLTVFENLAFGLKMRKMGGDAIKSGVREVANALSIDELLDRRPAELSGGERRRVAIGRAIVRAPQVFLFDEPLTDLDPPLRRQLRGVLKQLQRKVDVTTVYVTHDQAEALSLADRIGVLHKGAIQQVGTAEEVFRRPATAFVASFFGEPGMNLIPGIIADGRFRFESRGEHGQPHMQSLAVSSALAHGPALLGIRPSDLSLSDVGAVFASVRITDVEDLGDQRLGYFDMAGFQCALRGVPNGSLRSSEQVQLFARPQDIHFFSATDGRRLN